VKINNDPRPPIVVRRVNWADLRRANPIDVSERGDVVLAWVDGAMVADPYEWERPRWDADLWEQRLAGWWLTLRPDVMIGAFSGDELVGLASLRYRLQPGMAQLTTLHVSQAYRRQGIASQLMAEIVRMAREGGAASLYVSAVPSASAIGFYTNCGFRPTDVPDPDMLALEPEDIHMIREL
jgi:GNAT superfamily N-acetyltransferase